MAGTTSDKLNLLRQIKEAFLVAITGKGQSISDDEPFSTWPAKVTAIETGIDTSDATATAADMANGVTAYVNGEKVTGSLNETKSGQSIAAAGTAYLGYDTDWLVGASYQFANDRIYRAGSTLHVGAPASEFGDATAADVAAGKTFTSAAGLKVTGTGSASSAPVTEDVTVETTSVAGLVTFTVSKPISKVCAITFAVESSDYYGYFPYLYLLNSEGEFIKYHVAERSTGYFIAIDDDGLTSGELISGNTVTYGFSGKTGWKNAIPAGSFITATITYVPA